MIDLNSFTNAELNVISDLIDIELENTYDMKNQYGHKSFNMKKFYIRKIDILTLLKVKVSCHKNS